MKYLSQVKDTALLPEELEAIVFTDFPEDDKIADAAIVLGNPEPDDRVEKAAELYLSGKCRYLCVSGGVRWDNAYCHGNTEAEGMQEHLMQRGVPENRIIVDNLARTTTENMICGILAIQRVLDFEEIRMLTIVTSEYHMRRSMELARMFLPSYASLSAAPAMGFVNRNNWKRSKETRDMVFFEASLMQDMIRGGCMKDIAFRVPTSQIRDSL